MLANINKIAKETLITLKERNLHPTPENYTEIFEELCRKYKLSSFNRLKLDKYKALLLPNYQQELNCKCIDTLEQMISFLIAILNRQSGKQFSEFFNLLSVLSESLQVSKDTKVKDLAKITSNRISKTMDSENIHLLSKKWKEFQRHYHENDLEHQMRKYGIRRYDDFNTIIKKLLHKLHERNLKKIADLLISCLNPSLVEDLKIHAFGQNLASNPSLIIGKNFKNEVLECVNRRVMVDNAYVQKNLNFFNDNFKKIHDIFALMNKSSKENIDFVSTLIPDEKGEIKLSFELLKQKFTQLDEKINALNIQLQFAQNLKERESWDILKELEKLDENYHKYKINYSLALFCVKNYRFIMEKYGLSSLNEIFVRFKKILQKSCNEFDELWMIDEKTYLIISTGKSKEDIAQLVEQNLKTIKNFRFIYKQDIITPKIITAYLDKQSRPNCNILDQLIEELSNLK